MEFDEHSQTLSGGFGVVELMMKEETELLKKSQKNDFQRYYRYLIEGQKLVCLMEGH